MTATNPAVSRGGRGALVAFFLLMAAFLYAPLAILTLFSFNQGVLPSFPIEGLTTRWYTEALSNDVLLATVGRSLRVAVAAATGATLLGLLGALMLTRQSYRGKAFVAGLLISPLVVPYVVLGVSLLIMFRQAGVPLSMLTVTCAHIVLALPFAILVFVPRLQRLDPSLEAAARTLGASVAGAFVRVSLPLLAPAALSAFLIAFTISFTEFAVAAFVVGTDPTFPVFLYSQLRFLSQLPQVIAFSVIVLVASLVLVVLAEWLRRRSEQNR